MKLSELNEDIKIIAVDDGEDLELVSAGYELFKQAGLRAAESEELNMLAMDGNKVIGAVTSTVIHDKMTFSVVVAPSYQRQGIGKRLIDAIINDAKSLELKEINGQTVNKNLLAYLISIGFEHQVIGGQDWAFLELS